MKKLFLLVCLFVVMAMPAQSYAEDTDMGALTCETFNTYPEDAKTMLIIWIDGYMSGEADVTISSEAWFGHLATHMVAHCAANPAVTFINAANEVAEFDIQDGEDVLATPCAEILANANDPQESSSLLMWVDGYLSSLQDNLIMSQASFQQVGEHIGAFCQTNQGATLGDALSQ